MPLPLAALLALAGTAQGVGSLISGIGKSKKAKELAANNIRPTYNIPQGITDNLNLSENLAGQGISTQAKDYFQNQADKGLNSQIDAILKGGGDINTVGNNYSKYLDSMSQLSLADDQRRLDNIRAYMAQNQNMADYRDKAWNINQYAPYADKAALAAQMLNQGQQQQWSGINTIGSSIGQGLNQLSHQQDIKALLQAPGASTPAPTIGNNMANPYASRQWITNNLKPDQAAIVNNLLNYNF